jgi:hypothetical protein
MTRPRIVRLLRVAVSTVCGILCLLLIALWVRSYAVRDMGKCVLIGKTLNITSGLGQIAIKVSDWDGTPLRWNFISRPKERINLEVLPDMAAKVTHSFLGIRFASGAALTVVIFPQKLPVLLFAMLSAAPWIFSKPRFSLRTLLLATTLVAVALGLVVAMR